MKLWKERIEEAEVAGSFTEGDIDALSDFRTCAVSEGGLASNGRLKNNTLHSLGIAFINPVFDNNIPRAWEIWEQIQDAIEEVWNED